METTNSVVEELLRNDDDESPPFDMEELKDALRKLKDGISPDVFDTHTEILNRSGNGAEPYQSQKTTIRLVEKSAHNNDIQEQGKPKSSLYLRLAQSRCSVIGGLKSPNLRL